MRRAVDQKRREGLSCRQPTLHHLVDGREREVLRHHIFVDVVRHRLSLSRPSRPPDPHRRDLSLEEEIGIERDSRRRHEKRQPLSDEGLDRLVEEPGEVLRRERRPDLVDGRSPRPKRCFSDVEPFFDEDVLEEKAEDTGVNPVDSLDGGGGEEEVEGVGYSETDVGDGVAEEGEEARNEVDEGKMTSLEEVDALGEGDEFA